MAAGGSGGGRSAQMCLMLRAQPLLAWDVMQNIRTCGRIGARAFRCPGGSVRACEADRAACPPPPPAGDPGRPGERGDDESPECR
jgi:hypothetical protein